MIAEDEGALRCDMLETYHIMNYRALPARDAALFACGLGENSRIMRKISNAPASFDSMLLAIIADALRILVWQNTKDGMEGRNVPNSILSALLNRENEEDGFETATEFEAWRNSLIGGNE